MLWRSLIISLLLWKILFIAVVRSESNQLNKIPAWAANVPEDSFIGISRPSDSIEEGRQQAILSAVSQILQAMGAEYSLTHESILTGTKVSSQHQLNEKLSYTSKWFIRSVQQSIRRSEMFRDRQKYVYFVLVHFPPSKLEKLRKLTIGPKISARIVGRNREGIIIEAIEASGVGVNLTDYGVKLFSLNRHAGLITLFAWKVPKISTRKFECVISPSIHLQGNSKIFYVPYAAKDPKIWQIILGTETRIEMTLSGYDEIGRPLSFPAKNF